MLGATDRVGISDLVHRYAAAVDDRQFDSVVQLFTEAAELILPDPPVALEPVHRHRGHTAIGAAIAAVVIPTEHAIVGEVYDVTPRPDVAHGRVACVAHHWSKAAISSPTWSGICATTTTISLPMRDGRSRGAR